MSILNQYLKNNMERAYDFASKNTVYVDGKPIIPKGDEWISETEWDDLFLELSKNHTKENK